jgi:hypothetical protein
MRHDTEDISKRTSARHQKYVDERMRNDPYYFVTLKINTLNNKIVNNKPRNNHIIMVLIVAHTLSLRIVRLFRMILHCMQHDTEDISKTAMLLFSNVGGRGRPIDTNMNCVGRLQLGISTCGTRSAWMAGPLADGATVVSPTLA